MKIFYGDTNLFLRFFLEDDPKLFQKTKQYLQQAQKQKIKIIVIPEIILEMEYILKKQYKFSRQRIASYLYLLVKTSYLEIIDREAWFDALSIYPTTKIDLVDIFLFEKAKNENTEVLAFDEDFRKLKRISSTP